MLSQVKCCSDAVMGEIGESHRGLCLEYVSGEFTNVPCEFAEPSLCCPGGQGPFLPFIYGEARAALPAKHGVRVSDQNTLRRAEVSKPFSSA